MIEFKSGNILKEQTEALVNTVNCVGVMGRGIALQFKKAYPENFKMYLSACKRKEMQPGSMLVVQVNQLVNPKFVINFPTKRHWRGKSRIKDIETGLESLVSEIENRGIRSIALPPLGCGLGGLQWEQVKPLMEKTLSQLDNVRVVIFEPSGAPSPDEIQKTIKIPKMTAGRAALIGLIDRYLKGLMDLTVTLLEIQKLMYFMQEAGQPLNLKFGKDTYGPYAKDLGHVLNYVEGHFLSGYVDGGNQPGKEIKLIPGAVRDAEIFLANDQEVKERFRKVVDLVDGFETPIGMELLVSVHWVVVQGLAANYKEAVLAVHRWSPRKQCFTENQIKTAYRILDEKGWFNTPLTGTSKQLSDIS